MELWLRERMFSFVCILVRVPPLFVIDLLLRIGFGVPDESTSLNITDHGFKLVNTNNSTLESTSGNLVCNSITNGSLMYISPPTYTIYQYEMYLIALRFLVCCFGCVAAICTFILRTKDLLVVYLYFASVGIVFVSYLFNMSTIDAVITYLNSKEDGGSILPEILNLQFSQLISSGLGLTIIQNYAIQSLLAHTFCYIHLAPKYPLLQKILACSFIVPSHIGIYPLPISLMTKAPFLAALIPLLLCIYVLWSNAPNIRKVIYRGYQFGNTFMVNYGIWALLETQWARLQVPNVLRTFWILRVAEQVIRIMSTEYGDENFNYYNMMKTLVVNGCETLTALLGMTSIISVICHYIGSFFYWVLLVDSEDEKSIGTVSAMLFYILALQTGLTSLDKESRLLRLYRNLCLLFTAMLHFIHNIVNPLLVSLSASHNSALHKHIRALAVCIFLVVFPVWLLTFFWSRYAISTWLLAVTVFSVEIVIKVFLSLAIYSLFLYDAYRKSFWDELDDWVYLIRSFGNAVEFAFGIILFFNGFWILVFEAGGTIRAIMMCVHAYFNLWCEAKAGWSAFMKRRYAVNKINLLLEATEKQLREHSDVCAICYQDIQSAKITKCNHFFHSVCLRKWLYVQDRCPLCHKIMYMSDQEENERNGSVVGDNREVEPETGNSNVQGNNHEEANNAVSENNAQDTTSLRSSLSTNTQQEQTVEER